ncbi:MAG: transporter substrate-binding domain-containing protein [Rhodothermales bacterium]|nr:transporter substrate-binding domain-containing protein [Rhodothermales bacterium]
MKLTRLIALVAVLALVAAACNGDEPDADNELGLIAPGVLTVCTDAPYSPMEFEDENGEYTGFEIELMRAIATELGLSGIEVVNTGFDPIESGLALNAGDCDIAAASITILPEREERVDFADGHFTADQSLLVRDDAGVTSLAEFGGLSLAVQSNTTGEAFAQENAPEGTDIRSFENPGDVFVALEANNVQGVLQDIVPNADYALNNEGVTLAETFPTNESYGFAVKEGAADLLAAVNAALQTLRDNGTYDQLYNEWFG